MAKCFVIQPFDDGNKYDKRYDDVFEPAIRAAQLKPYRVDRDPSVGTPIDDIERGIKESVACLAEISTDNPNVWYELGFAFAHNRLVVLVCSDERRGPFPFDIQHRKVIKYSTESPSDFKNVESAIAEQLRARLKKRKSIDRPSVTAIPDFEDLDRHELKGLVIVAADIGRTISVYDFYEDMEKADFHPILATLARHELKRRGLLEEDEEYDDNGNSFDVLRLTNDGMAWLIANKRQFTVRTAESDQPEPDDDLPF